MKLEQGQLYILCCAKESQKKMFQLNNLVFLTPQGSASRSALPVLESKISLSFTLKFNKNEVSNYSKGST